MAACVILIVRSVSDFGDGLGTSFGLRAVRSYRVVRCFFAGCM
jgi:hypothetical protein